MSLISVSFLSMLEAKKLSEQDTHTPLKTFVLMKNKYTYIGFCVINNDFCLISLNIGF